jgi:uncharacterized protein (TIGR00251 family)
MRATLPAKSARLCDNAVSGLRPKSLRVLARELHADQARHGQAARRRENLARIAITVSPGAARSELVGRHGDGWRARVAAPPERGRANDALVELFAGILGVTKARVRVVAGQAARRKVLEVEGLDRAEVERLLETADT